jgi:hypothetical protein
MAGDMPVIWLGGKLEYFCDEGWTGQISLKCLDKLGFTRKRPGMVCRTVWPVSAATSKYLAP